VKQHFMHTAGESFHVITPSDRSSFTAMKREACSSRLIIFAMPECYICTISREGCETYNWQFFYKRRERSCQSIFPTEGAFSFRCWLTVLIFYTTDTKLNKKYFVFLTLKTTQIMELYFQKICRCLAYVMHDKILYFLIDDVW